MRFIDVANGVAHPVEGVGYPVDVTALASQDVAMVVFPDNGGIPWIEREPFRGREQPPALLALAHEIMAEAEAQHATPAVLSLDEAKADKLTQLVLAYKAALAPITDRYPTEEREGWRKQEDEARAFLANPSAATPYLSGLNQGRGRSMQALAESVVQKADEWLALSTAATRRLQVAREALDAIQLADYPDEAAAVAAVDAIRW